MEDKKISKPEENQPEKPQREPDVLVVEMPPCRMVTSGPLMDEASLNRFDAMWMRLAAGVTDKINPRDFMYHDAQQNTGVWMYLVDDAVTEADTEGYAIIRFEGGLFAAVLADNWERPEYDRVSNGVRGWLARQAHLAEDEDPQRTLLYHFAGPHSAQMKAWNLGKVRYFFPIRTV